jgi:hypothetical protein
MRAARFARKLVLSALVLGASLVGGCKSYHYYDVDIKFASGVTLEQAGMLQFCTLIVSGADSGTFDFPDNNSDGPICPVQQNYPDLGTFEYSTFEDTGTLHFVVSGYSTTSPMSSACFASGSTDIGASDAITTAGNLSISVNSSGCVQ